VKLTIWLSSRPFVLKPRKTSEKLDPFGQMYISSQQSGIQAASRIYTHSVLMAEKYLILQYGSRKFTFNINVYLSYCIASHPRIRVLLSKIQK